MTDATLVLGASGFIGTHLLSRLADEGEIVTGTYRTTRPSAPPIDGVRWTQLDILDRTALHAAIDGHDRVYHAAGIGLQAADPRTVRRVNAVGTRNVVEAAQAADIDRLLFVSTAGTRRTTRGCASEADVARPIGAYQESKSAAEALVDAIDGIDTVTVHPTSVIGPGDPHMTGRLFRLATTPYLVAHPAGGASVVDVGDVVEGMIAAMSHGRPGDHYTLGGENLPYGTLLERIVGMIDGSPVPIEIPPLVIHALGPLAEIACAYTGRRIFPFDRDMARLSTQHHYYSSEKAATELGYTRTPLDRTIERCWEWYRSPTSMRPIEVESHEAEARRPLLSA